MRQLLFILWLVFPCFCFAQDVEAVMKEARADELSMKESEAFVKYGQAVKLQPTRLEALCRASELACRIGARQPDMDHKRDYFNAAKTFADAAMRVAPNSSDANFVMAFSVGRQSQLGGTRNRVAMGRLVYQYSSAAVKLDPDNFKALHVLARWNFEVSNLNVAERSIAKLLYGGLPQASLDESIRDYEKSMALQPNFLLNYLELARALHRKGEDAKARAMLNKMLGMPNAIYDDTRIKASARQFLLDWK